MDHTKSAYWQARDNDQVELIEELQNELREVKKTAQERGVGDGNLIDKLREELTVAHRELKTATHALIMMTHSREAFRYTASQNYDAAVWQGGNGLNDARKARDEWKRIADERGVELDQARKMYGELAELRDIAKEPKGPIPPLVYWDAECDDFYGMKDCISMGKEFRDFWYAARNEFPKRSTNTLSPSDLRAFPHIRLNAHEIQSGVDRVRYAAGLIAQLPKDHDGRNTWLLNYGTSDEAFIIRRRRGASWDGATQSAYPAGTPAKASTPAGAGHAPSMHWFVPVNQPVPPQPTRICAVCGHDKAEGSHYCQGMTKAEWEPIGQASIDRASDLPDD